MGSAVTSNNTCGYTKAGSRRTCGSVCDYPLEHMVCAKRYVIPPCCSLSNPYNEFDYGEYP
ncbi:hypothetical protein BVRB_1g014270 [Beta vulgaris subsp. vulgaris]|nr:hypothetical protein BVRB_1g014270 [Beta vulgaris subsp. vulgaris]